jgi:competence protein ComEC
MQLESGDRLYVTVPYEYYDVNTRSSTVWYPTGTKIQVEGVLSLPDQRRNPGGFDETAWLLSKKTGVKLNAERISVLAEANGIWYMVYRLHNELERILYQTFSVEQADLAMALLTGAKHRLSDEFYVMTQRMGIAHIFAVSGLHVGVIGSVVLWSFHYMGWTRSWVSVVILAIGLGLYCMLAGLPASALRATGMILLSALAIRLYRPPNALNYLAFAAMVILLDNPFILWSAGFQLSFGVTLALLMFVSPIQ